MLYYMLLFLIVLFVVVPDNATASLISLKGNTISVEIKGEVDNPGVYTLERGCNVQQLLELAGLKEDGDLSSINKSSILANEDVIVIPTKTEQKKISINSATVEDLCSIPGIGEVTAQKIIDYRNSVGSFKAIDDLLNVKGIGEKKLDKIREYICL